MLKHLRKVLVEIKKKKKKDEEMYECIVLLVYDMHIYLQHLQDICVCCRSIAWAVAQYF